ncbi:class D beta-lactamase [Aminobacter sp. AP02]|uniref:class D beta-lactamase n=1 Tax=Aminobacter sp. AP02 TaxID=2135737 RepID=UPI001FE14F24|nr:class D beta-lactamase [Aminobacter sp. AP02]
MATAIPASAQSATPNQPFECSLIVDAASGETVYQSGVCDQRVSPASTFKLPLALVGYDAGILVDEHTPSWDYKPEFKAFQRDHRTVDPTIWERDSVVWFSQEITRSLGDKRFAAYVDKFDYGNKDITGNAGKKDGLTHSWLSSSLKISPVEQIGFLRDVVSRKLPVSAEAYDMTNAILPAFQAGDWHVQGKTGSGWLTSKTGKIDRNRPFGWFIGWAEKDGRKLVFARLVVSNDRAKSRMGLQARADFLKQLPTLVKN